jgi:hypothetical protein
MIIFNHIKHERKRSNKSPYSFEDARWPFATRPPASCAMMIRCPRAGAGWKYTEPLLNRRSLAYAHVRSHADGEFEDSIWSRKAKVLRRIGLVLFLSLWLGRVLEHRYENQQRGMLIM